MKSSHSKDQGFILVAALLLLLLLTVLSAGMIFMANAEIGSHASDLSGTQTYYVAEAGMEKMMVDLANLYMSNLSPTQALINANVSASGKRPTFPGYSYATYQVTYPTGFALTPMAPIKSGANAGLLAQKIPMRLTATARKSEGEEVSMSRQIEVALIPVFQFGLFSDTDLTFHAGTNMSFAGRIHTNGNLYLSSDGQVLTFGSKVSSNKEIILDMMPDGVSVVSGGRSRGRVFISTVPGCCSSTGTGTGCVQATSDPVNMSSMQNTVFGGTGGTTNSLWLNQSQNILKGQLVNRLTGGSQLSLPFVSSTMKPIEIVRRPPDGEDANSAVGRSRLYNLAQIRVLMSDRFDQLPGGQQSGDIVLVNNAANYPTGVQLYDGTFCYFAEGHNDTTAATTPKYGSWVQAPTSDSNTEVEGTGYRWPLIGGVLRVERRIAAGSYENVTLDWLKHGFARCPQGEANSIFADAILVFQMLADINGNEKVVTDPAIGGSTPTEFVSTAKRFNWFPINSFDAREGIPRSSVQGGITNASGLPVGGIMSVVELNVGNLKRWLDGSMASSIGSATESTTQNGYLLYYSDRRGCMQNPNAGNLITGESGLEDVINNSDSWGYTNSVLDQGEDGNGNNILDNWGIANLGDGFTTAAQGATTAADDPYTSRVSLACARGNRVTGARHVLRLVNGGRGNLPRCADNTGGFTLATENPVYIAGNYNADATDFPGGADITPYSNAAIIADSATLLSPGYRDINFFTNPIDLTNRTASANVYLRVSISSGKHMLFNINNISGTVGNDFGSDGGVHNFVHFLENWGGRTVYFKGSIVSLYYSTYATGVYKGGPVYSPPSRAFSFDSFLTQASGLPPGTPRFVDISNLGYFQNLTAGN